MSATVYSGAVAPESYRLNLTPGTSGVDLSTVSAASLSVQRHDGTEATWAVSMSNQTSSTLTLTHVFVVADTAQIGTYRIRALLTIPGGTVRSVPTSLDVLSPFGA